MEGVGARLGRSSTRFAPTAAVAFRGPVRKWTKRWVPLPNPSSSNPNKTPNNNNNNNNKNPSGGSNDDDDGNSHLILYKWTPISSSSSSQATADPPKRRKFRYVPISVVEGQNQDGSENSDSEAASSPRAIQADDVLMEDAQAADNRKPSEEANETDLDLNLS